MFVDHESDFAFVHIQVSQRAGETIIWKNLFESLARTDGVQILHNHTDTGVCSSDEFNKDCSSKSQTRPPSEWCD